MSRIRTIKPDFFLDSELAKLKLSTRYFFIGLWTQADKEGRIEGDIPKLKVQILPYDKFSAEKCLDELIPKFVLRYENDSKIYFLIKNFTKHQRPHHTEPDSKIPPPSKESLKDGYYPFEHGALESKQSKLEEGREGKGRERILDTGVWKGKESVIIPDDLQSIQETILSWLSYKLEKGQAYKPTGLKMLWKRLRELSEQERKVAIERSMANNWAGIFSPKGDQNGKTQSGAAVIPGKYAGK